MSLFRIGFAACTALLTTAASAYAADPPAAPKHSVYVCERPTLTRHVSHPQHGRLSFVSARQLLGDPTPAAKPRCITPVELERLRVLVAQRSQTLASR